MDKGKSRKGDSDEVTCFDKTSVLQEARQYFMSNSAQPKKLIDILTKCIYIVYQGERLAPNEATDLFFHITRLFQYEDSTLRRLTHIAIKSLSHQAENVYVVTSSLIADVNSFKDDPALRASALRTLCEICDSSTYPTIERYLRQGVVDKHPVVASAALTSLIKIAPINMNIVQRCTKEIQEALMSDSPMVQYHALSLRYMSCKNDRLAIARLITVCIKDGFKSPLAQCLLIKIITNYINDNEDENTRQFHDYIRHSLTSTRNDMVEYEAANALVNLKPNLCDAKSRAAAVTHLRNFLSSSKAASRFAAVRSLNKLALTAPDEVRVANLELELLISKSDCNRSIAILAITTLLKTGTEKSVETFLKQIGEFLSEIDDEFKVIVVGSIGQLCEKYPAKHAIMMDFLSDMLRQEGGYLYKKAIVDTIINIIELYEETKDKGLEQLCEFIEDCEHDNLAIQALHIIGRDGPKTRKPASYLRFIANRLLLDGPAVGSAAITALAKFGTIPELAPIIKTALQSFTFHEDYEVIERAIFYKEILNEASPAIQSKFITSPALNMDLDDFEDKLINYLESENEQSFNMNCVAPAKIKKQQMHEELDNPEISRKPSFEPKAPTNPFDKIDLGPLIKSSKPCLLTDSVAEFVVQCTKHFYQHHVVLQLDCTNTVNSMCLEDVSIEMLPPPGFHIMADTICSRLAFEETSSIYICTKILDETPPSLAYFTKINMKYKYRIVDTETSEVDPEVSDEEIFPLEDLLLEDE